MNPLYQQDFTSRFSQMGSQGDFSRYLGSSNSGAAADPFGLRTDGYTPMMGTKKQENAAMEDLAMGPVMGQWDAGLDIVQGGQQQLDALGQRIVGAKSKVEHAREMSKYGAMPSGGSTLGAIGGGLSALTGLLGMAGGGGSGGSSGSIYASSFNLGDIPWR